MLKYEVPIDVMLMSKDGGEKHKLKNSDELEEFVIRVANMSSEDITADNSHIFIPLYFFQSIAVAGLTMTECFYDLVAFLMERGLLDKYDFSSVIKQEDIETVSDIKGAK